MLVEGTEVVSTGGLRGYVRLRAEYYEYVTDGLAFAGALKKARVPGHWFTCLQETLEQGRKPGI